MTANALSVHLGVMLTQLNACSWIAGLAGISNTQYLDHLVDGLCSSHFMAVVSAVLTGEFLPCANTCRRVIRLSLCGQKWAARGLNGLEV